MLLICDQRRSRHTAVRLQKLFTLFLVHLFCCGSACESLLAFISHFFLSSELPVSLLIIPSTVHTLTQRCDRVWWKGWVTELLQVPEKLPNESSVICFKPNTSQPAPATLLFCMDAEVSFQRTWASLKGSKMSYSILIRYKRGKLEAGLHARAQLQWDLHRHLFD